MWRSPATWPASCSWSSRTSMTWATPWSIISATRSGVSCSAMRRRLAWGVLVHDLRAGHDQVLDLGRRVALGEHRDLVVVDPHARRDAVGDRQLGAVRL